MREGFTLIELVIVVTILAILAAVAIPIWGHIQEQARNAATRGALAAMREAIQQYRMNEILSGRRPGTPGSWPDNGCPRFEMGGVEERPDGPWVMENGIVPDNPWAKGVYTATHENWVIVTICVPSPCTLPKGELIPGADTGWRYIPDRCDIWANTAENGGPITENEF